MRLPTLFKRTSTGACQEWSVWTEGNVIRTRWGQSGGKMQEGTDVIREGKNLGKKNETTPTEQAQLEARSLWGKKKKRGYHEDAEAAMAGETDAIIEGGIFPMLAHKYEAHAHKIEWPAFAQPKLDGHRCIAVVKDGKASLWSRTRKPILHLPHIIRALEETVDNVREQIFDGELYTHEYRDNFEALSSHIRQKKAPKDGHEVVQYHIYDWARSGFDFHERAEVLQDFFEIVRKGSPLQQVRTMSVADERALISAFRDFRSEGYEGAMIRNAIGTYKGSRSYDLLKVKEFQDGEFPVIDVKEGRGKMTGRALFIFEYEGRRFDAKMKGPLDELKKYIEDPALAIGRLVTVQYQGLTTTNQVPRCPVAIGFRDDL